MLVELCCHAPYIPVVNRKGKGAHKADEEEDVEMKDLLRELQGSRV